MLPTVLLSSTAPQDYTIGAEEVLQKVIASCLHLQMVACEHVLEYVVSAVLVQQQAAYT
jgi:hypothetical protein